MAHVSFRLVSPKELSKAPEDRSDRIWDTEKKDFISTATHQLRSPLVGVKWTINMLINGEAGDLNHDQKTWLKAAYRSNERVTDMVDSMLNALRVEAGAVKFVPGEVDIVEMIHSLVEELVPAAQEKEIELTMEADDDIPPVIADEEKLRVAIQNLVHNSVKYTPEGGEISVDVTKEEGNVKLAIADTGIGIPAPEQKDVFRRFFRGSNAMRVDTDGTGLGLYISKNVVERHNGQIWFDTTPEEGTIFYVVIPYKGLRE